MMELLKQGLLLGLGALDLTKERVGAFVDQLIQRGELAQQERKATIDELLGVAKRAHERLRTVVERTVAELGLPTKADIAEIERRLADLEKKIG